MTSRSLHIVAARPDTPDARELIAELDSYLHPLYPSESRHGFSVEMLVQEEVAFFVMRCDDELAGCGGLKIFHGDYAEIKRMYVRPEFRRMGFARKMLEHLSGVARQQKIQLLRLETGIYQTEAIGLYEAVGFQRIDPFGDYRVDPLSLCYERGIA